MYTSAGPFESKVKRCLHMCHHIGFHRLPTANPTHRQVVTGLFMIGIDQVIRDDCACNPLLNDLVIDPDDELVFF